MRTPGPILQLRGIVPPAITPFRTNGSVHADAVSALVERMVQAGVTGLFVLGSSGEGPTVTESQRSGAIRAFVAASAGRLPILAGVMEAGVGRALEATRAAADLGADAIVVSAPTYYAGMDEAQLIHHFDAIAATSSVPCVAYNIPSHTQNLITAPIVCRLAEAGYIGMKDSSANPEAFSELLAACHDNGMAMLQGAESLLAQSILDGADGAVPGISNLVPELAVAIYQSSSSGDQVEALRLQTLLDEACSIYHAGYWLPSLKYAAGVALGATPLADGTQGLPPEAVESLDRLLSASPWIEATQ